MLTDKSLSDGNFSSKLLTTLDHVEYRRIESHEDFEDVARLRFRAYKQHGVLPVNATRLIDEIDFDRNAHVFGVYYDEELVSTIRIHYVTPEHRVCQSIGIFPEAVNAMLDAGMTMIDSARFAIAPEYASELSAMPYLTVRLTPVAAIYSTRTGCCSRSGRHMRHFIAASSTPSRSCRRGGFRSTIST